MTSTNSQNLVRLEEISHITIDVSEEINQKDLNSFLLTQFKLQNQKITFQTLVFASFVAQTKQYEIYFFDALQNFATQIDLIANKFSQQLQNNEYALFFIETTLKKYYLIFKNSKLFLLKQIDADSNNEVFAQMLTKKYKLELNSFEILDLNELQNQENVHIKYQTSFYRLVDSPIFKSYITYCLILVIGYISWICFENITIKNQKEQTINLLTQTLQTIKSNTTTELSDNIIKLSNEIQRANLPIEFITYEHQKLTFGGTDLSDEKIVSIFDKSKLELLKIAKNQNNQVEFLGKYKQ